MKLTSRVRLVPTLRMYGAVSPFSIGLRNVLLDFIAVAILSVPCIKSFR